MSPFSFKKASCRDDYRQKPSLPEPDGFDLAPASGLVDLREVFELADQVLDGWRRQGAECQVLGLIRGRLLSCRPVSSIVSELKIKESLDGSIELCLGLNSVIRPLFISTKALDGPIWLVIGRVATQEIVVGAFENTPDLDDIWLDYLQKRAKRLS